MWNWASRTIACPVRSPGRADGRDVLAVAVRRRIETAYGERADSEQVQTRLDYELGIIHKMGFDAYFLIVWDLCRYARQQDIWY